MSLNILGFKVWDDRDLDRAKSWVKAKDLPVTWIERPFMGRVLRTRDPFGIPLEFYSKMDRLPPVHQQYKLYRGVKPLQIDHFNMFDADADVSVVFYGEIGFRVTKYTADDEMGRTWAAWMHRKYAGCMMWPSPMAPDPGRHGISNPFFLYIRDQDGHRTENYCGDYRTCDPDQETDRPSLKDTQRQTLWGALAAGGFVAQSPEFPQWRTLTDVIRAGAIAHVLRAAEGREVTHIAGDFLWGNPLPDPGRSSSSG